MPTALCIECGNPACRVYCSIACRDTYIRRRSAATFVERFWSKVNKIEGGCWLWTAGTVKGYGQFNRGSIAGLQQIVRAHRFSWEHFNGPVPGGLSVLHRCDVTLCVNPDHLFLGTQSDNLTDARAKGRLVDGRHLIKVDDSGLADIRANYCPRKNGKQLATQYGITLVSLLRIVNGTQRVERRGEALSAANAS